MKSMANELSKNSPSKVTESNLHIYLQNVISSIESFLESQNRLLVITGMIGTGLSDLIPIIQDLNQVNNLVLAPNRRIASLYSVRANSVRANSIYIHIYSSTPKLEPDALVYKLKVNQDSDNQVYILGDAHLISDSQFESDNIKYGSGHLLSDFFSFINLHKSSRKVILIGDPFQLRRGVLSESSLYIEKLKEITGYSSSHINLENFLPNQESNLFVRNCLNIVQSIEAERFNNLQIMALLGSWG